MSSKKKKGLNKGGKPVNGDINVTPLIDVVLVLLIIFMVITPIMIEEMAVNLPQKTEKVEKQDIPKEQLVAAVCEDGSFTLNKTSMDLDELATQVSKRLRRKSGDEKVVFIDGHPDASYDRIVNLIDTVRASGAERVGIASLKEGDSFLACGGGAAPAEEAPASTGG